VRKGGATFSTCFSFLFAFMPSPDLRYPIGQPVLPTTPPTPAERAPYLQQLAELPAQLLEAARRVGGERLQLPYRPGGWTGRQVIHHMNAYCRCRLALTENAPTVRLYDEAAWAELPDVAAAPITVSLSLLENLHMRWVVLLQHLDEQQWQRRYIRPISQEIITLDQFLVLYAWHGRHHLAHLNLLTA
jgi:hypothetical protein